MQRTPNLGLPQFEPSDKYRLEDYNEAYMKIDEKIKELKDKEAQLDTKLAEAQNIIDTWTQFKNNGGEISGNLLAIQLATKSLSNNYRWVEETHNTGYKIISSNTNPSTGDWREEFIMAHDGFAPKNDKVLGTSENPWKNIYLNGMYRSTPNGYSKLPNGLIMQWGTWVRTASETNNSVTYTITFPTSFPNTCLQIVPYASAFATTGNWAPQNCASAISDYSTSDFKFKFSTVTNIRNELKWIAIGY